MASVRSALTQRHYLDQVALRAQAVRDAHRLWATYRTGDAAAWRRLLALAVPLVQARYGQSAAVASRYYDQLLATERGATDRRAAAARRGLAMPADKIETSLTQTGLVGVVVAKSHGLSTPAAMQSGFVRFQGGLSRLALTGGRDALVASVVASSIARGWQRVTSGDPCTFCADLAGESSTPDEFQAHDNCTCTAEPTFG